MLATRQYAAVMQDFRQHGHELIDWVAAYLANPREYPVAARCEPGELRALLPASGPTRGEPLDAILADFHREILPRVTHWNHPRFHAYFSVSSSAPGVLGELLTGALNVNAMLWKSCPAATDLEQVVAAWVLDWLGLPASWFGMIVDCASTAVFHAMVAARERAGGPLHNLAVYISGQTHSSVEKAAIAAGIDRANIRCIDLHTLGQTVRADIARGLRPFFVAATVGTTSSAAIDLVPAIAYVCRRRRLWLHVDGAYGGAFGLLPECRHFLEGVERADSFIVNPHKGMMVPLDCSLLYTARPEAFRAAFALRPEYLKTDVDAVDFTDYGLALGRRFRALKLWFVLRYFGREGIAANLRKSLRLAAWLAGRVAAHPRLELAAPVTMGLVCFRVRAGDDVTRDLMRRLNDSRRCFVSHTVLEEKVAIRVAIGNAGTRLEDLEELWAGITEALSQSLAMDRPTASVL